MNTNFEHTPTEIFDWIEVHSFAALNATQQQQVLKHFSQEEYEALHQAALSLKSTDIRHEQTVNAGSKKMLLEKFDAHYGDNKVIPLFSKSVVIWQAASVILFMLCGGLVYNLAGLKKDTRKQQTATLDTVFVTREIRSEPSIIRDTIYLYKQASSKAHASEADHSAPDVREHNNAATDEDIYVVPIHNGGTTEHIGSSMKDDSLLKKYTFVSM